jgi:MFS family permease
VVPIEVVYAKETIGTGDAGYGLLIASWGVGVVAGSAVFLGATKRNPRTLILLATLAVGAGYLGMGSVSVLWAACAFSVLGGLGNGVQWVSVMTAIQEATPADLQARITGLLEAIASAATGIGFLAGGVLTSIASAPFAFVISGAGVTLLAVGALLFWHNEPHPPSGQDGDGAGNGRVPSPQPEHTQLPPRPAAEPPGVP